MDDIGLFTKDDTEDTCFYLSKLTCQEFEDCLTKEEAVILADMRALREKALEIKNKLKSLEGHKAKDPSRPQKEIQSASPDRQALIDELENLREKRKKLDRLMEEAHHRKMVMLGHREP